MAVGEFQAKLINVREIAPDVRHFVFEALGVDRLVYTPGQFVFLHAKLEGKPVKRAYSIASPPAGARFELCLNRVREGVFSPFLFDLNRGDTIHLKGPYGVFQWREPVSDSVLVATGTGIAPLRAMLHARVARGPGHCFTLLFGVRYLENLLYREEFEEMAALYPNFRFWPTLTRPAPDWTGRAGRVQEHLVEATGARRDVDVYVCGLREMVEQVRDLLGEMGLERRRVIYERYD